MNTTAQISEMHVYKVILNVQSLVLCVCIWFFYFLLCDRDCVPSVKIIGFSVAKNCTCTRYAWLCIYVLLGKIQIFHFTFTACLHDREFTMMDLRSLNSNCMCIIVTHKFVIEAHIFTSISKRKHQTNFSLFHPPLLSLSLSRSCSRVCHSSCVLFLCQ